MLDYVTFMKVEKTAYLKIRFDWLFSIYVVFVVAVDRPLPLARLAGAARQGAGGVRSDQGGRPAYEPRQPVLDLRSSRSPRLPSSACRSAMR